MLHQVAFGSGKRNTHRMIFAVRSDKVMVYAIRYLAQQELTVDDLI